MTGQVAERKGLDFVSDIDVIVVANLQLMAIILAGYGWAGLYGFIDPDTGIAAVYATQVVPTRDAEVVALFQRLEETIYKAIV